MSGERTEKATAQRKKKSRERGEGPHSRELISAAAMLGGLLLLKGAATQFVALWRSSFEGAVATGERSFASTDALSGALPAMLLPMATPVAATMVASFVAALGLGVMQTGGLQLRAHALAWKPGRLNPGSNLKNIVSAKSLLRFMKSLLPAAAVLALGYSGLRRTLLAAPVSSVGRLPSTLGAAYTLALDAAWISVGWSALDYAIEWRSWNSSLKMSKQEIRDEARESNGNPQIKQRVRQIQNKMRRRRARADVAKAAVVITNPTHYAVALAFSFDTMAAPRLLAKGRDLHAAEIREQARWAGVPIVENAPLARSLYRSVEEGQSIPYELYAMVAAILAFLFRQTPQGSAGTAGAYGYAAPARTVLPLVEYLPPDRTSQAGANHE